MISLCSNCGIDFKIASSPDEPPKFYRNICWCDLTRPCSVCKKKGVVEILLDSQAERVEEGYCNEHADPAFILDNTLVVKDFKDALLQQMSNANLDDTILTCIECGYQHKHKDRIIKDMRSICPACAKPGWR